ncbi:Uncharacterised protein [BD1-7 clade bacterium]|uniref:Mu-like prophage FluMu protein gp29 n=1 Tax=BD1-7 clade bacterium TaxID=2029982 RepID=A0A5S9P396_9GAMM|nr:Uncharacterised protein [BD1-7 clade bacterium]CAA0122872.1 Uncharacterised protein [BD1-7 clade bacterium]
MATILQNSIILDHTGAPIKKRVLTEHIDDAQLTGTRNLWGHGSIASDLTPMRLASVLQAAADGDHHEFLTLAEEMEERDLHYSCELSKRKLAIAGIEPIIEASADDQKAINIAAEVRSLIHAPEFADIIDGSLDGLGKGYGITQVDWQTSARQWIPSQYTWRDPRYFAINRANGFDLHLLTNTHPIEGEPLQPYRWVIHRPRVKMGLPIRGALARLAATAYMCKSFALGDWMTFSEVFGMPIRIGKYHSGATPDEKATLRRAVASIGSDASAIMPEQMRVELLERKSGTGGDKMFEALCSFLDKQVSKGILGQTMTAEDGASNAQAQVHNEVRQDICRADCRQLEATINRHLIEPYVRLNHGPQTVYPRFKLPLSEPEDLTALTNGLDTLVPLGLDVATSQIRDKFGLREPQQGEATLGVTTTPPAIEPTTNQPTALNRQQKAHTDDIDALTEALLDNWQPQMQEVITPIQQALAEATTADDFKARLPELLTAVDPNELVKHLANGMFRARGLGDATDQTQTDNTSTTHSEGQ